MENKKELVVSAIENGTVIDHIPTDAVYQAIRILGLENYKDELLIGNYLESGKLGRKGIIKIKNKHFTKEEINKIALVAPFVTIINIEDFKVVDKFSADLPDRVDNIVRCANPKCITNAEAVPTRFEMVDKETLKMKCHYCEKYTTRETMKFIE